MNTDLSDQKTCVEAVPLPDDCIPVIGAVTSTPTKHIDSTTFLQQQVFTGFQFNVPLPMGAVNGFEPMFAVRVQPVMRIPHINAVGSNLDNFLRSDGDYNYSAELTQNDRDMLPVRTYGSVTSKITGPEPPQSVFARSYRYNRCDIVYTLRIVSTYTGGGIIMAVPFKGLPRGSSPISYKGLAQIISNGMLVNSNVQCDLSKSRQMRFVYPYEYPTEFQDICEDTYFKEQYTVTSAYEGPKNLDNWFIVGTRGSIITPTNADSLTFYLDYAFSSHQLMTPLLPCPRTVYPTVSLLTDGTKTMYAQFDADQFSDYIIAVRNTIVSTTKNVSIAGKSNIPSLNGVATFTENTTVDTSKYLSMYISTGTATESQIPTVYRTGFVYVAVESGITCMLSTNEVTVSNDPTNPTLLTPNASPYRFIIP